MGKVRYRPGCWWTARRLPSPFRSGQARAPRRCLESDVGATECPCQVVPLVTSVRCRAREFKSCVGPAIVATTLVSLRTELTNEGLRLLPRRRPFVDCSMASRLRHGEIAMLPKSVKSLACLAGAALILEATSVSVEPAGSSDVVTYHYDNARSGLNANEVSLSPATVTW